MSDATVALMSADDQGALLEKVVVGGDLKGLSPAERVRYYRAVCQSVGVNPLTKPFEYIVLNGKLTLYATRTCTDQIRANAKISVTIVSRDLLEDVYVVTAQGRTPDGRLDEATGAVSLSTLKGEAKANAMMKAETKSKRRLTLSMAGLGWLDESEIDSVPSARRVQVDTETGEIHEPSVSAATPKKALKAQHPLLAAGLPRETVTAIAAWIGEGAKPAEWSEDQRHAAQAVTGVLLEGIQAGIAPAELAEIVQAYAERDTASAADAEALVAQVRAMVITAIEEVEEA